MRRFSSMLMLLVLVASALFAVDRYLAFDQRRSEFTNRTAELQEAKTIYRQAPESFGGAVGPAEDRPLKPLVQAASNQNRIRLNYLSETEKELGKGVRERSVIARTTNVPHAALVAFLAEVEAKGGGARIKEIRLKPSPTQSGVYQDAECVVSRNRVAESTAGRDR